MIMATMTTWKLTSVLQHLLDQRGWSKQSLIVPLNNQVFLYIKEMELDGPFSPHSQDTLTKSTQSRNQCTDI